MQLYKKDGKRLLDIVGSFILLFLLSPVFLIVSLIILIQMGRPIFYTQSRPGKHDRIFKMYKFRSMTNERDESGDLLPDNERITKFGLFIRKSSLDELPEIWNILKGDMSFIGPRPLSIHYLPFYTQEQRRRHEVRPGLSGLAQVSGRNTAPWPDRMAQDLYYVDHLSLWLDIKIIFLTFWKVFKQSGIHIRTDDPMLNFNVYQTVKEGENVSTNPQQEIGSEFEWERPHLTPGDQSMHDYLINEHSFADYSYTINGRNAIGLVLDDIMAERDLRTAYLPAYACVSMIQPFLERGIDVEYYAVKTDDAGLYFEINPSAKHDLFFFMEYFGYETDRKLLRQALDFYRQEGIPIVQDNTHNFLTSSSYDLPADYAIISLRKWLAIPAGGIAYKASGDFKMRADAQSDEVVTQKIETMKKKAAYLDGELDEKSEFLMEYADFNNSMTRMDARLSIDSVSLQLLKETAISEVKRARQENAQYLYEALQESKIVRFLFKDLSEETVPLFVPLIVKEEERDELRQALIAEHIYLPVHWPENLSEKTDLPNKELSLVCDQRYTPEELERMVQLINQYD